MAISLLALPALVYPAHCQIVGKKLSVYGLAASEFDSTGVVASVHDGDTLRLKDGRKVRLIGVNTPELAKSHGSDERLALEAAALLRELIPKGSVVKLKLGVQRKDKYGRTLAHIFTEKNVNVTEVLLRQGLGFQVVVGSNVWGSGWYRLAEKEARENRRGLWGSGLVIYGTDDTLLRSGFALVRGQVERVVNSKSAIWIEMVGNVVFRVSKQDWPLFEVSERKVAAGLKLEGRGWVIDRHAKGEKTKHQHKRWLIPISHPIMLNL